jgi:hypothetical protein
MHLSSSGVKIRSATHRHSGDGAGVLVVHVVMAPRQRLLRATQRSWRKNLDDYTGADHGGDEGRDSIETVANNYSI